MGRIVTTPPAPPAGPPAHSDEFVEPDWRRVVRIEGVAVIVVPLREGRRASASQWTEVSQLTDAEPRVVLDLRHYETLDRQSLGGLIRCLRRVRGRGGEVSLCGLSNKALMLLELTGAPYLTSISETPSSAVRLLLGDEVQW